MKPIARFSRLLVAIMFCVGSPLMNSPLLFSQSKGSVSFVTDEEKRGGFLVALTEEAFARGGYAINVEYIPWARALKLVMNGDERGLLGAYFSPEREKSMHYSDPIAESELGFFALKASGIKYRSIEDLRPYAIGVIKGASYPPEFERAGLRLFEAYRYDTNIENTLEGNLPLFIEKRLVVMDYMRVHHPSSGSLLVMLDPPLSVERFFVCFSRRNPRGGELARVCNAGIASMRADATWEKIVSAHRHE